MEDVMITTGSITFLIVLWIIRVKLLKIAIKEKDKTSILKKVKIYTIDIIIIIISLKMFGTTNFGIQTSAMLNLVTSIVLPIMIK